MWSDGQGQGKTTLAYQQQLLKRQEKERKQEEETEMKKINIDEGITKKRENLGDRCIADEKHQRYEDDRRKHWLQ